jgi:hypothetical protein
MEGKSTKMLVAALKFRFNFCEKRDFDFKRLIKASETKHLHRVLSQDEIKTLDIATKNYHLYRLGWHIMYDLACRV